MINDVANCVASATTRARVPTLLIGARFVSRTVRANHTLGSASRRCSIKSIYTTTYGLHIILPTLTIRAARRWIAWIFDNRCFRKKMSIINRKDVLICDKIKIECTHKYLILTHRSLVVRKKNTLNRRAQDKCISIHSRRTTTHRDMIVRVAYSILTAYTRTGIHAFVSHTCLRIRAIIIQHALRTTTAIRIPKISRYTSANSPIALGIRSARRGRARIFFDGGNGYIIA